MRGFAFFMVLALAAGAACADLPAGVVLRFSCDEIRSGPALPDMTGSNHSGRVSNVRATPAGRLAGACEFTGKNSYVAVPDFPELNSKGVTLCAWFRTIKVEGADRTLFDRQPASYQEAVLPLCVPTVAIEAAHPDFWRKYVGRTGRVIGIASFGESAPAPVLYRHFGITTEAVVQAVKELV